MFADRSCSYYFWLFSVREVAMDVTACLLRSSSTTLKWAIVLFDNWSTLGVFDIAFERILLIYRLVRRVHWNVLLFLIFLWLCFSQVEKLGVSSSVSLKWRLGVKPSMWARQRDTDQGRTPARTTSTETCSSLILISVVSYLTSIGICMPNRTLAIGPYMSYMEFKRKIENTLSTRLDAFLQSSPPTPTVYRPLHSPELIRIDRLA